LSLLFKYSLGMLHIGLALDFHYLNTPILFVD
jgi:hypothetical protein